LSVLEHEDIEQILRLLDATPVREFELETERFKIILRRESGGEWTQEQEVRRAAGDSAGASPILGSRSRLLPAAAVTGAVGGSCAAAAPDAAGARAAVGGPDAPDAAGARAAVGGPDAPDAAGAQGAAGEAGAAATSVAVNRRDICAPLVGTFYRAPKPGALPFVESGAEVRPDSVVAIVETMKLMTSIHAGHTGRVAEILVDDGHFVEQDQVLMRVIVGSS
jgi:acetyl-CoA carboxylase biotin carboxyl carrier protein